MQQKREFNTTPPAVLPSLTLFSGDRMDQLLKQAKLKDRLPRRVLFWITLTWLPLMVLSLIGGKHDFQVTVIQNFPIHFRFLLAMVMLIILEEPIEKSMRGLIPEFLERGLVQSENAALAMRAVVRIRTLVRSKIADVVIFCMTLAILKYMPPLRAVNALEQFWYRWISLLAYNFILLRWIWKYILWSYFLLLIAKSSIRPQSHHPDRAGGLGFLLSQHLAFGLVATAISIVLAANVAKLVLQEGHHLTEFVPSLCAYFVISCLVYFLPLSSFTPSLIVAKKKGLKSYGHFGSRFALDFENHWSNVSAISGPSPLGNQDISTDCDLNSSYSNVEKMTPFLMNRSCFLGLVTLIVFPLLLLMLVEIPIRELVKMLSKVLI